MLLMGTQGEKRMLQGPCLMGLHDNNKHAKKQEEDHWMIMEGDDNNNKSNMPSSSSTSAASSLEEDSSISNGSSTASSDLVDDASSSSSNSSSVSNGPLFELSELMSQLPIKRGLSKYFDGKSQSFTSLSSVKSLEDLAKKENPYRKRIKTCKSYGGGLDNHRSSYTLPKATISKKVSRGSFSSLSSFPGKSRSSTFLGSTRPPTIPVQKHF